MTLPPNSIHLGDCLDIVPAIPDESKEKKYYDIAVKRLRETEAQRFLL